MWKFAYSYNFYASTLIATKAQSNISQDAIDVGSEELMNKDDIVQISNVLASLSNNADLPFCSSAVDTQGTNK